MNNFDVILMNPPYGKIGAEITKSVIDNIDFNEYINLLPANDYKRLKNLYNFISDLESVNDAFDAAVTTHMARIHKSKVNNMTVNEFEISTYVDPQLDKYFAENFKRNHYAIDGYAYKPTIEKFKSVDINKMIYFGHRDAKSKHLPYSNDSITSKVNFNKLTNQEILDMSAKSQQKLGKAGDFEIVTFNTEEEKSNIVNFMYSKNGFRFISKLFTALNIDSWAASNKYLPKVDWTRPWTVEEILADYGYTGEEIAEIMSDLDRFKQF